MTSSKVMLSWEPSSNVVGITDIVTFSEIPQIRIDCNFFRNPTNTNWSTRSRHLWNESWNEDAKIDALVIAKHRFSDIR